MQNEYSEAHHWETKFASWAKGPSPTEQEKAANAERQIRQAINSSEKLKARDIRVFTQGSYRNRVNVRLDSDVDVGVVCYDTYFPVYPDDNAKLLIENRNKVQDATYTYAEFKNELEEALIARFGKAAVQRGSKAFDIKENSYRVNADVAAFFEHRRYNKYGNYISGVEMRSDNFLKIINWPEQHYENGIRKNNDTYRKYKRIARIVKSLSNEMSRKEIISAIKTPSFLVECLVWNTPNHLLSQATYYSSVRETLVFLNNSTLNYSTCKEWGEVSDLKYLFNNVQPWTLQDTHQFIKDAWDYIGFK